MSLTATVFAPLFAQVALVFVLLFCMAGARMKAIRSGALRPQDIALGEPKWPAQATKVANCFANQFEAPVLFYVLTVLRWNLGAVDTLSIMLAWAFVVTRYLHALEFTTTNIVMRRGAIFAFGMLILLADWILFAVRVLAS
jgi:hypothetical protein